MGIDEALCKIGDPRDCWPAKGNPNRYGYVRADNGRYAHYLAYAFWVGLNVKGVGTVFQTCHNRKCCNPHHLKSMTLSDYIQSLWSEGKFRELDLPKTLLMDDPKKPQRIVKRIRVLWLGGYDIKEIKWRIPGLTVRQILYYLFPNDMRQP